MILDTNALSAFADGMPSVVQQIAAADELHIPVIVLGEYRFGIATSRRRREYARWLARGHSFWNVLPIACQRCLDSCARATARFTSSKPRYSL